MPYCAALEPSNAQPTQLDAHVPFMNIDKHTPVTSTETLESTNVGELDAHIYPCVQLEEPSKIIIRANEGIGT